MPSKRTIDQMDKAREKGEFSDFEFTCQGQRFPVHRIIVCSQSPVFHAACTSQFKEATSRTYNLDSHQPSMVKRMVEFFYTCTYNSGPDEEDSDDKVSPVLSIHAAMFNLADKYNVEELTALASKRYLNHLESKPDVPAFLLSLPEIYKMPADSSSALRCHAVNFARLRLASYLESPDNKETFGSVLDDLPEFASDLVYSAIQTPYLGYCNTCSGKAVPIEPLQSRCEKCGKGGARAWRKHGFTW